MICQNDNQTNRILHVLRHGVAKNGKIVMERMTNRDIASALGVKTVSQVLYDMSKNGLIKKGFTKKGRIGYWRCGKLCV